MRGVTGHVDLPGSRKGTCPAVERPGAKGRARELARITMRRDAGGSSL